MAARKALEEKLSKINDEAKAAIKDAADSINRRAQLKRGAAILMAPAAQLIDLGINNPTEHTDVKAYLDSKRSEPETPAARGGKAG